MAAKPCAPTAVLGNVSSYLCTRYGFSSECKCVAWSGDNPCSLAGLGLTMTARGKVVEIEREVPATSASEGVGGGDIAVSLGTSDVLIASTSVPNPGLEGHVFVHPTECGDGRLENGGYMGKRAANPGNMQTHKFMSVT